MAFRIHHHNLRRTGRRAFALPMVVVFLVVFALLAFSILSYFRKVGMDEVLLNKIMSEHYSTLVSANNRAAYERKKTGQTWAEGNIEPREIILDGVTVKITIEDEAWPIE